MSTPKLRWNPLRAPPVEAPGWTSNTSKPNGTLIRPSPEAEAFYSEVLQLMAESGIPFLVSGTYALASYTGIDRPTKDVDVFAKAGDALKMLHYFKEHGFESRLSMNAGSIASRAASCSSTSSPTCRRSPPT